MWLPRYSVKLGMTPTVSLLTLIADTLSTEFVDTLVKQQEELKALQ